MQFQCSSWYLKSSGHFPIYTIIFDILMIPSYIIKCKIVLEVLKKSGHFEKISANVLKSDVIWNTVFNLQILFHARHDNAIFFYFVAVFINAWESVFTMWSDSLYLCCDSPLQWSAVFRHHPTLGCDWLASNYLYGK